MATIEGICSFLLVADDVKQLAGQSVGTDGAIIQYDPDLGVIYKPNLDVKDLYAPGVHFQTNAQSFRHDQDLEMRVPEGKTRIICAGDSFTVGEGVGNKDTWCYLLAKLEPSFETVNLGQGGFGLDQIYLRYKRDGLKFEHQILIFAFIANDLIRMDPEADRQGARKPFLEIESGKLVVKNVPVPKFSFVASRFPFDWRVLFQLRIVELIHSLKGQQAFRRKKAVEVRDSLKQNLDISFKAFEDLAQTAEAQGIMPVFVYLPTREDYAFDQSRLIRAHLMAEFGKLNALYIDLTPEMSALPSSQVDRYFLKREDVPFARYAANHYSVDGHKFIASKIYDRLLSIREGLKRAKAEVSQT